MAGTKTGGINAAKTIKQKYGDTFYAEIGRKGGRVLGTQGGFASEAIGDDGLTGRERARIAGKKGGLTSRRGKSKKNKTGEKPNA